MIRRSIFAGLLAFLKPGRKTPKLRAIKQSWNVWGFVADNATMQQYWWTPGPKALPLIQVVIENEEWGVACIEFMEGIKTYRMVVSLKDMRQHTEP